MTHRKPSPATDADLLAIPPFLRRDTAPRQKARSGTPRRSGKKRRLPPDSMVPVMRAVKRGRDTLQKLRATLGDRYSDAEIRAGLAALMRIGSVHRVGRRYLPLSARTPPNAERP